MGSRSDRALFPGGLTVETDRPGTYLILGDDLMSREPHGPRRRPGRPVDCICYCGRKGEYHAAKSAGKKDTSTELKNDQSRNEIDVRGRALVALPKGQIDVRP